MKGSDNVEKEDAIKILKEIRNLSSEFETYETREIDLEALEYAIKELERTAQEVPVQEQLDYIYPTNIEIKLPIKSHNYFNKSEVIVSDLGIILNLKIDSNLYTKSDVLKQINLACQKLLEYF